jgi:hypothetical protein
LSLASTVTVTVTVPGKYTLPHGNDLREQLHTMGVMVTADAEDGTTPAELSQLVSGAIDGYARHEAGTLNFGNTDAVALARQLHKDLSRLELLVLAITWADSPTHSATVRTTTP